MLHLALLALQVPQARSEREEDRLYFVVREGERELELVEGRLLVETGWADAEEAAGRVLAALPGWRRDAESAGFSLFSLQEASGEGMMTGSAASARATRSAVRDAIRELADVVPGPYTFSPILRDPDGFEMGITSKIAVRFRSGVPERQALERIEALGGESIKARHGGIEGAYLFEVPAARSGFEMLELANRLASEPLTEWAEPDFLLFAEPHGECVALDPDPTSAERLANWWVDGEWGIRPDGAWDICGGSDDAEPPQTLVTVGIIGDGVDLTHPDLYKAAGLTAIEGMDFVEQDPDTEGAPFHVCDKHETTVAGAIVMASGGGSGGGVGSAPKVRIKSARAHRQFGNNPPCLTGAPQASEIVNALEWLRTTAGAKVINYSYSFGFNESADDAIAMTLAADVMIFASAGNAESQTGAFPADRPGVTVVGGSDQDGKRWRASSSLGSNFGPWVRYAAPGVAIFTTDRQGTLGYNTASGANGNWVTTAGTSYASPLVAGVAALIRSLRPDLTAAEVDAVLCATSRPLPWDQGTLSPDPEPPPECGLVDASAALTLAQTFPDLFEDDFETGDAALWTRTKP